MTRSGTTVRLFVNGVLDTTTGTASGAINTLSYAPIIGAINASGTYASFMNGNISNLRIINGTALYTSTFTPPTAPLTAIANTVLLTCQSATLVDNSVTNYTINPVTATLKPVAFSPFTVTNTTLTTYNPTQFSGSVYFNGTTDYLSIPYNPTLNLSNNNFTIEGWFYFLSVASGQQPVSGYTSASTNKIGRAHV